MNLTAIIAVLWLATLGISNWYTANRYEKIGIALEKQNTAELINAARKATDKLLTDERAASARSGQGFETQRQTVQQVFTQLDNEARYEATINKHTAPVDAGACELPASRLRRWNDANRGAHSAAPAPAPSEPATAAAPLAALVERRGAGARNQPPTSSQTVPRAGSTGLRAAGLPSLTLPSSINNSTFKYGSNPKNDE
jgi:hypothetical protein